MSSLARYLPESHQILDAANAERVGASAALLAAARAKLEEVRSEADDHPKLSDDIRYDIRYQLGMIAMAKWIMTIPDQARKYLETLERR